MPLKIVCPNCGAYESVLKHGRTNKSIQRYKCKECNKTFILNDSPTKHLNISDFKIKRFLGYMIDDVALDVIARNLKINIKTAHYYRFLVFHSLKEIQKNIKLSGSIIIDETFIRIKEKKYKITRLDGKGIRGLSYNQLCVITLVNLKGLCTAKVSSRAMALPHHYIDLFNNNIGKVDRFLHDGNSKQVQFMNQYKCEKIDARRDPSGDYSTDLIDSLHSNIKRYLFKHAGYRLKNLQHYLNFFVYRYNYLINCNITKHTELIKAKNSMINDLYIKLIKVKKSINYRNYLNDKGILNILESKL